jgi:hypothetical protein
MPLWLFFVDRRIIHVGRFIAMFIFTHQIVCTDDEPTRHEKSKHKHSRKHKKEKKHKKSDEDKQLLKAAKKFLKESAFSRTCHLNGLCPYQAPMRKDSAAW